MKKWKIIAMVQICIILFAAFTGVSSQPSPPCMDCGWNPFEHISESGGTLQYSYVSSGGGSSTLHVRFVDKEGNPRREFYGDEIIYLHLSTNASSARFAIYEWYPSGTTPQGHWLRWGNLSGPGIYEFGPFFPEAYEPEGIHSWEIWLLDLGTGELEDVVERFDYQREVPPTDTDNDGVPDSQDNCPNQYNPDQKDADNDGTGDVCDSIIDTDNDGVPDSQDNCPNQYNPDQKDADNDGTGDVCDPKNDRIQLNLIILFIALAVIAAAVVGIIMYRRRERPEESIRRPPGEESESYVSWEEKSLEEPRRRPPEEHPEGFVNWGEKKKEPNKSEEDKNGFVDW
jgi:hypothetical protein